MAPPWEMPELDTDEDAATSRILESMGEKMPGWEAHEGSPEVVLAEEIGRESAILSAVLGDQLQTILAGIGETVFGLPAHQSVPATLVVDVTVTGVGAEIPAGFTVTGTGGAGTEVAFTLDQAVTATTNPMEVTLTAVEAGAASNGVTGDLTVVTATATVSGATAAVASSGGVDEETLDGYVDRLTDWLGRLRPGGVTASDLAVLARSVAGVHRALGLDLHDPTAPGVATERTATIVPLDTAGQAVAVGVANQVAAVLEAAREVNFVIHVAAPTYTGVDVVIEAVASAGANPVAVDAAITAAVSSFLSPATWGATPGDDETWTDTPTVRYLDLVRAASTAAGVDHLDTVTLNGGTVDVALTGPAPLPSSTTDMVDPTTIAVTVV